MRRARPSTIARLADAGLADEHRVVLGAPREHLDHATDLVVAPDHRVELALAGLLGEVAAVALERLVLVLGVLARDAVRAAHRLQRLEHRVLGDAETAQEVAHAAGELAHREEDVLGGEVVVAEIGPLGVGRLEEAVRLGGERGRLRGRAVDLRDPRQGVVDAVAHRGGGDADPLEHGQHHALGLADRARRGGGRGRPGRGCARVPTTGRRRWPRRSCG